MHMLNTDLLMLALALHLLSTHAHRPEEPDRVNKVVLNSCSSHYADQAAQQIQNIYSSVARADCDLANPSTYPAHYNARDGEEFDFIIVGAGSAGSVVANRLTEVSGWNVLLLEAGDNPTKTSEVPALFPSLQKSELDWKYQTEPSETYCLGTEGNRCNWPRGKVLGGSSTINYMLYVRGNPKDYDSWAAEGNSGWGYNDVLPYFKKSEDMRAEEILSTSDYKMYHGKGGYLKVDSYTKEDYVKPIGRAFAKGMKELGYAFNQDCNGRNQTGFAIMQGTLEDGRRCSTAKAFLVPASNRQNLKVSKRSLVTKILVDSKKKTAFGVEFVNEHGKIVRVHAKKEVIVSAGAINTPQLLMLSGIGPKKHLEELNINVVENLPVGKNLQDHMLMGGLVVSLNISKPIEKAEESMFNFLLKRNSKYSGLGVATYAGFINTLKGTDYPDVELLMIDFAKNNSAELLGLLNIFGFKNEIKSKYLDINAESYTILVLGALLRPYSRGMIQLRSSDPMQHPNINAGYFSDKRDIETFLRTYDFVSQLVQTKAIKDIGGRLHEIEVPACSRFQFASREYRECSLRHLTTTTYHYCSTCKMGPPSSPDSVVDSSLRVKGIHNLRVIDASVMPSEVSGNINAAVIMIGEKGSDLIKEAWLKQ